MLKAVNETRWSARADVLRAQVTSRNETKNAIEDLIEDNTQTPDTRVTGEGFRKILESFQTTLLTVIWDEILQRVDKTSEILQREELDLLCATKEFLTLSLFLSEKRPNFDDYEARALQLVNVPEPNYEKIEKRKFFSDEKRYPDFERMYPRERFRAGVFLPIIGNLEASFSFKRFICLIVKIYSDKYRGLRSKAED
ncbi:dimer_Tnp_hAT domain-containing protein [Trichonephila clavata]|uniref:Dimer_Tnp_hAT domain-containing protein n=1 Tax=Trichonephila clavata TaxID=2740835 RepID=A0A8X6LTA5_TRICU|nr:dimer_Tnp_hAT domain-containing protein [Trichonephila clavata]